MNTRCPPPLGDRCIYVMFNALAACLNITAGNWSDRLLYSN